MTAAKCGQPTNNTARARVYLAVCWLATASLSLAQQLPASLNQTESPNLVVHGDTATFTTAQMIVVLSKGQVTRIFNRLTGTEYIAAGRAPKPESAASTGLVYAEPAISKEEKRPNVIGPRATNAGEAVLTARLIGVDQLSETSFRQLGPLSVQYDFAPAGKELTLTIIYALEPESGGSGGPAIGQR